MISKLQQKTNDGELQQKKRSRASPSNWVDKLPKEMWTYHVLPCSTLKELKELSELSHNSLFSEFWKSVVESCHHIHVVCGHVRNEGNIWEGQTRIGISERLRPQLYCSTIERAVYVATHMSVPGTVKIELSKGVHEIRLSYLIVTCSHITFVGKGKYLTTIRGGFYVENQQHVKFEELTLTNSRGRGLLLAGSTVDVLKCAVKECQFTGMCMRGGATATATQCEFMENGSTGVFCRGANTKARLNDCTMHHNGSHGLFVYDHAVVDLHGTKTDIHFNKYEGIAASDRGKVNIHLPSQHNTTHGNVGEDRAQITGGSIANINADGTIIE